MSVVYGLQNVTQDFHRGAVAVGVFDGVHWGHRAIFERLKEVASQAKAPSVALTFNRHPAELLAPDSCPPYITTLEQRVELIHAAGVDHVVVAEFDHKLANLTEGDFLRVVLGDTLHARHVVVGSNFLFGKARKGNTRYLMSAAPGLGMMVTVVPSVVIMGGPASSTRVRSMIARGDVAEASKLLGRRFALRGSVVPGEQIGRTMGFPTANIQPGPRQLLPARGVYAVEAEVGGTRYSGLCNVGCRPTFGGERETIEVHLIGFQGNVYGATLDVVFVRRLRDEIKFESPEKLAEQIQQDMERAKSGGI